MSHHGGAIFFFCVHFFFEPSSTTPAGGPQSLQVSLPLLNLEEEEEASSQRGDVGLSLLLKQEQTLQTLSPYGPVAGGNFGAGFGEEEEDVIDHYQTGKWRRKSYLANRYVGHELADYCVMRVEEEKEEDEEIMPSVEQKDFVRTLLRMRQRSLSLSLSLSLSYTHTHTHTHTHTQFQTSVRLLTPLYLPY